MDNRLNLSEASDTADKTQFQLSDESNEIISFRPSWIIRNGNLIFLIIISLLLIAASVIRYPDIIKGSVKFVAVDAPKLLVATKEGKLQKLLVKNQEFVKKGDPLAILETSANPDQIFSLRLWLTSNDSYISTDSVIKVTTSDFPVLNSLGELQSAYEQFRASLDETRQLFKNGYYEAKRQALKQDLIYVDKLGINNSNEIELQEKDLKLQEIEYKANEDLANDHVIAPIELNQIKSKLYSKQQGIMQLTAQAITNNIDGHNKRKELLELAKFCFTQQLKFKSDFLTLKSQVLAWIQQYIVTAPESGKVVFISFLQNNELLQAGEKLFFIKHDTSSYYAQIMASQDGFGKIKVGQDVLLKVNSFPSSEFGYLRGTICYISDIPTQRDSFLIKVDLPKALSESNILLGNDLVGEAQIITDNRKLLYRFFGELKKVADR